MTDHQWLVLVATPSKQFGVCERCGLAGFSDEERNRYDATVACERPSEFPTLKETL